MLKELLKEKQIEIDNFLEAQLPESSEKPSIIHEAMRYSVFAGGKRIRPAISLLVYDMLGGKSKSILYPACAVELIHTYSLIHDDLPALDNDDFRRGKPSSHKKFGEAIAILAGDALLTLSFEWIANMEDNGNIVGAIIKEVSESAGVRGMIGGQVADLEAEGRLASKLSAGEFNDKQNKKELEYIHLHKTAALIRCSVVIGALCAGCDGEELQKLKEFGTSLGLAFQVADDILDIEGDQESLGKTVGKDVESGKLTYPALYGLEESKTIAKRLIDNCKDLLKPFQENHHLLELSDMIINRKS